MRSATASSSARAWAAPRPASTSGLEAPARAVAARSTASRSASPAQRCPRGVERRRVRRARQLENVDRDEQDDRPPLDRGAAHGAARDGPEGRAGPRALQLRARGHDQRLVLDRLHVAVGGLRDVAHDQQHRGGQPRGADQRGQRVREARPVRDGRDAEAVAGLGVAVRGAQRAVLVPRRVVAHAAAALQVGDELEVALAHDAEQVAHPGRDEDVGDDLVPARHRRVSPSARRGSRRRSSTRR